MLKHSLLTAKTSAVNCYLVNSEKIPQMKLRVTSSNTKKHRS